MPKPIYIICSESGSEDRVTNSVSHFNVLEQIELRAVPEPAPGQPTLILAPAFQVDSVWLREDTDDPEQLFECEVVFHLPEVKGMVVSATKFAFEKPRYRYTVRASSVIGRDELSKFGKNAGIFVAECRVRKFGDPQEVWTSQYYPLAIVLVTGNKTAPADQARDW